MEANQSESPSHPSHSLGQKINIEKLRCTSPMATLAIETTKTKVSVPSVQDFGKPKPTKHDESSCRKLVWGTLVPLLLAAVVADSCRTLL